MAVVNTVDRFLFSNDSRTTLATGLSALRYSAAGFASSVAGYFAGGNNSSYAGTTTVDRFLFSNDSRTTLGTGISTALDRAGGAASSVAGYVAGGYGGGDHGTVDRFLFADDSRTTLGTGLSVTRRGLAGMASTAAGYFGGGYSGANPEGKQSTVDRFLFADDTRTTLGTGLSVTKRNLAGFANLGA